MKSPRLVVAAAAAVLLASLGAAWVLVATQQRGQVRVWFDARPVECLDGAVTVEDRGIHSDPVDVHVIDAAPELNCWLRVHVEHRGWLAASVHGLELPMHGPRTGGGIRASELAPLAILPEAEEVTGERVLDAVYRFDYPLEPGAGLELRLGLDFQPDGCMSPDARSWVTDAPAVEVSVLALRGTRTPTGVAFAQRGTQASSCDER